MRAYYSLAAMNLSDVSDDQIIGAMATQLPYALEPAQREAWRYEIDQLRGLAGELPEAHIFFEFVIPRMGRRADVVVVQRGLIFVVEYKVGASHFDRQAIDQVYGYALDLKHFHETSHDLRVIPVLVATEAVPHATDTEWFADGVAAPIMSTPEALGALIRELTSQYGWDGFDPLGWANGRYKPTPTIIEAAQALYSGHDVQDISRSESGAENLTRTAASIEAVIDGAKAAGKKVICFVTGVPGSGKTLAGLNIANRRMRSAGDEHAVFLSGNGPLVDVLREALTRDALLQARARGLRASRPEEERKSSAFIQNIHHFRDEALHSAQPPVGKVVVFDEAQRAWNVDQTSRFMREKRGQIGFSMSEPEFLLSVMDRHADWCAVICLVGGGQEINTGEAGIQEWLRAAARSFPHWDVHLSPQVQIDAATGLTLHRNSDLHLSTCIRSFRAERLSDFVGAIINGDAIQAREILADLADYPIVLTRDLAAARDWLRQRSRGTERAGLLASSNGLRLKPHGIFVKAKVDPALWFLAPPTDVRSSDALEDAATEFEVQGLELDWACVAWDANFRRGTEGWEAMTFRGTEWQRVADEQRRQYIANAYRVLLTRARQGIVIFVPEGDATDRTRAPTYYDEIFGFLTACGLADISAGVRENAAPTRSVTAHALQRTDP